MKDTKASGRRRCYWPEALKREIVAAALAPGASASVIRPLARDQIQVVAAQRAVPDYVAFIAWW
jgi:hypothetical protein